MSTINESELGSDDEAYELIVACEEKNADEKEEENEEEEEEDSPDDATSYEYCDDEDGSDEDNDYVLPVDAEEIAKEDGQEGTIMSTNRKNHDDPAATVVAAIGYKGREKNSTDTKHDDDNDDDDEDEDTHSLLSKNSSWTFANGTNTALSQSTHRQPSSTASISSSVVHQFQKLQTTSTTGAATNEDTDPNDEKKPAAVITIINSSDLPEKNANFPLIAAHVQRYRHAGGFPNKNDDDDDSDASSVSSWSTSIASETYKNYGGTKRSNPSSLHHNATNHGESGGSSDNRSTISGFDMISLNGTTQLACSVCTLINDPTAVICVACGIALLNNPYPESDQILAEQLQQMEDNQSFDFLERTEMKRRALFTGKKQSLLEQSSVLRKDVHNFVQSVKDRRINFLKENGMSRLDSNVAIAVASALEDDEEINGHSNTGVGYNVLPEVDMDILTSRFIETVRRPNVQVLIRFCFTPKLEGNALYESICKNGLLPHTKLSKNIDMAYRQRNTVLSTLYDAGPGAQGNTLRTIHEDTADTDHMESRRPIRTTGYHIGWIVALVKAENETYDKWKDNIDAPSSDGGTNRECITTVLNPNYTLPLMSFDASMKDTYIIQDLFKGLIVVCNDYFELMDYQQQQQVTTDEGVSGDTQVDDSAATTIAIPNAPKKMRLEPPSRQPHQQNEEENSNNSNYSNYHNNDGSSNDDEERKDEVSLSSMIAATSAIAVQEYPHHQSSNN